MVGVVGKEIEVGSEGHSSLYLAANRLGHSSWPGPYL